MADSCVKKSKPREGACRSEKMLTRRSSDADLRHFLFLKVINTPEATRVSAVISTPRSTVAGAVSVFIGDDLELNLRRRGVTVVEQVVRDVLADRKIDVSRMLCVDYRVLCSVCLD